MMTTPNAGGHVEKLDHSYITSGNVKLYGYFENSLAMSYKTKHASTIQPSNCILRHLSQRYENLFSYKNLYTVFTATLFIIAKIWKQSRFPLTD